MRTRLWIVFPAIIMSLIGSSALGQGLQSSPYSAPSLLRGGGLAFGPSTSGNYFAGDGLAPCAASTKDIPNLQTGYVYYSGKNWRQSYYTIDYILPIRVGENSIVFGEAHSELLGFSTGSNKYKQGNEQAYLSAGGGYRTLLGRTVLVGVNGFYDTARFSNRWLSSGGAGMEMAALLPGHDALDLNFNWYGDVFNEGPLVNSNRDGLDNFEFQAGYSHQLFDTGPDLRLYGTAYRFDDGTGVWGWQTGAELKSANGVLSAKFQTAYDPVNESYQTVGAFVNVGFQPENLLKGRNPFVMPEPIFSSPRNMNRLTHKVTRNFQHTTYGVKTPSAPDHNRTVTFVNNTGAQQTIYVVFSNTGQYTLDDLAKGGWNKQGDSTLYATIENNSSLQLSFLKPAPDVNTYIQFSFYMRGVNTTEYTQGELALQHWWGKDPQGHDLGWHEGYDLSLVDGFNFPVSITAPYSQTQDINPDTNKFYSPNIGVRTTTGNANNYGVFGLGNDMCCSACNVPGHTCNTYGAAQIRNESHPATNPTVNCPLPPSQCPPCHSHPCQGATQCTPRIPCQANVWDQYQSGTAYTVTFGRPQ